MNKKLLCTLLLTVLTVCSNGTLCGAFFPKSATDRLHEAAKQGDIAGVKQALKDGADIFAKKDGGTALHTTLGNLTTPQHVTVAEILIKYAQRLEDPNALTRFLETTNSDGETALQYVTEIAATDHMVEVAKYLISKGANVNVLTRAEGETLANLAAQAGAKDLLEDIIRINPALIEKQSKLLKETPLLNAVESGRTGVLKSLLIAGADPNVKNAEGESALMMAATATDFSIVRALMSDPRTEVDATGQDGKTALEQALDSIKEFAPSTSAAFARELKLPKTLIDTFLESDEEKKMIEFMQTAYTGVIERLLQGVQLPKKDPDDEDELVRFNKADPDKPATNGHTHLQNLILLGSDAASPLVELFIRAGADVTKKYKDGYLLSDGRSMLHVAVANRCEQIVALLLSVTKDGGDLGDVAREGEVELVVDVNEKYPEGLTGSWLGVAGLTPLHVATQSGSVPIVTLLLDAQADIDAQDDKTGRTPLLTALQGYHDLEISRIARLKTYVDAMRLFNLTSKSLPKELKEQYSQIVQILIDTDAKLDVTDKQGIAPVHLLARHGFVSILRDHADKIDFSATDKKGNTALHYAVESGDLETIRFLLYQEGVDVAAKNNKNKTALHFAAALNYKAFVDDVKSEAEKQAAFDQIADIVKLLLEDDAITSVLEAEDDNKKTAAQLAFDAGNRKAHGWILGRINDDKDAQFVADFQNRLDNSVLNAWPEIQGHRIRRLQNDIAARNSSMSRAREEMSRINQVGQEAYDEENGEGEFEREIQSLKNRIDLAGEQLQDYREQLVDERKPLEQVGEMMNEMTQLTLELIQGVPHSAEYIWNEDVRERYKRFKPLLTQYSDKLVNNVAAAVAVPSVVGSKIQDAARKVLQDVVGKKYDDESGKVQAYTYAYELLDGYENNLYKEENPAPKEVRKSLQSAYDRIVPTIKSSDDVPSTHRAHSEQLSSTAGIRYFLFETKRGKQTMYATLAATALFGTAVAYKYGFFKWAKRKIKYDWLKRYEPLKDEKEIEMLVDRLKKFYKSLPPERLVEQVHDLLYPYSPDDQKKLLETAGIDMAKVEKAIQRRKEAEQKAQQAQQSKSKPKLAPQKQGAKAAK